MGMITLKWLREPPFENNWFRTASDSQLILFSGAQTFKTR